MAKHPSATTTDPIYNTIVIGAGPIGIEVAAALHRCGVQYLHLEAGQIGHSFTRWAPQTVFYSSPEWIALCGVPIQTADQQQINGEQYLAYLRQLVEILDLSIHTFERVTDIALLTPQQSRASGPPPTGPPPRAAARMPSPRFCITTVSNAGTRRYRAAHVVLAVGNMQRYNTIDVPGAEQAHVSHALLHPHMYFRRELLIIGGKNSALEAALRCWRAGARVTISYRGAELTNRGVLDRIFLELHLLIKHQQITLLPLSVPARFTATTAILRRLDTAAEVERAADFVYVATGYQPDYTLYERTGVTLVGDERRPTLNPQTMETNVAGLYVAGTATAGQQRRYTVFITTCHDHAVRIAAAISGRRDIAIDSGNYRPRDYPLSNYELE